MKKGYRSAAADESDNEEIDIDFYKGASTNYTQFFIEDCEVSKVVKEIKDLLEDDFDVEVAEREKKAYIFKEQREEGTPLTFKCKALLAKLNDEDSAYCFEFSRVSGPLFQFYETFEKIKKHLNSMDDFTFV